MLQAATDKMLVTIWDYVCIDTLMKGHIGTNTDLIFTYFSSSAHHLIDFNSWSYVHIDTLMEVHTGTNIHVIFTYLSSSVHHLIDSNSS